MCTALSQNLIIVLKYGVWLILRFKQNEGINDMSNENNLNSGANDIVLPDCPDFDWVQIKYAFNNRRLIFINNYRTWFNFYIENSYKYIDYTPEELCQRFIQRVLPNIDEYELNEDELHLLNLLTLHPHFIRTDKGFSLVEQRDNSTLPSNEATIQSLMIQSNSLGTEVCSNQHILITDSGKQIPHRRFNFNEENSALLSIVFCPDEDLPNCEILTMEEIHDRLKAAKVRFENNGNQSENINSSVFDLVKKLRTLNTLKVAIRELVEKSFCRKN